MLSWAAASAEAAVIDYHLAVGFDLEQQSLHGTARLEIPAGLGVRLDLKGLSVTALRHNGAALDQPPGDTLTIAAGGVPQQLIVHYRLAVAGSPDNLLGPNGIALTGRWHPQADSDCHFHLQVSLPEGFEAVSEADQIDTEITAGGKTQRLAIAQALPSLTLIAGPYVVAHESFAPGKTLYSYFFAEDAELAADYRHKAVAYLQRYEALIGPYPYQRFSIVENRLPSGYGMATYTLLGQSVVRLPFISETSLGHEVLHSWFGNAVRVDAAHGNWCEGLTTYLADQAYAGDKGQGALFRKGEMLKYQHAVSGTTPLAVKDFRGAAPGQGRAEQAERAVGYGKVAMIFRMLEVKLGHEAFVAALRRFYQDNLFQTASWAEIEHSFSPDDTKVGAGFKPALSSGEIEHSSSPSDPASPPAGKEWLTAFFGQWLSRPEVPSLRAEQIAVEEKEGGLTLSFTLRQEGDTPFALEVPLLVLSSSGGLRTSIAINGQEQKVVLPLKRRPTALVLDPDYDLMRSLATAELAPSWDWFNGSPKRLAVVNSTAEYDLYQPLIEALEAEGVEIVAASEVEPAALADKATLFLGTSGPTPRALFASPRHPEAGLTLDIRRNPLNPALPMALMTAQSQAEVAASLPKLRHYGPYGYLHFAGGRAIDKQIIPAALGLAYDLEEEPRAIATPVTQGFGEIMAQVSGKRVIYVGESHTRFEDHQLQLRVIRELSAQGRGLAIGMEMFAKTSQAALDAFIGGEIDEGQFLKKSGYFQDWRFDYRLYRDILNFARANKIPVVALNIERDKVSRVYQGGGLGDLSPEEAAALPLDRDLDAPGYRERIHEVYSGHPGRGEKQFGGFLQSQAIWDEVMAEGVASYLAAHPERQMVVVAGRGHVVKENAIPPRVARRLPVEQVVLLSSDGSPISPSEADYTVFMPPSPLPPQALLGIVMKQASADGPISIDEAVPQSPAAKAGLTKGDIVVTVEGKTMETPDDIKIALLDKKVGDVVKVGIKRPRALFPDLALTVDVTL